MSGMEVVGGVASILQVITSVTKLAKNLNDVRSKYNNVALNSAMVAGQVSLIRAALEALHEWRESAQDSTAPSKQLDKDLAMSLSCCAILISVIDGKLDEAGFTPGMKGKIRYLWLEDILKEYISNLEGQVRALQLLLTIFQCRTATEQKQKLQHAESRTIIEKVQAETASLAVGDKDLEDAISILSFDPSVNFDIDSILMESPAYRRVYGDRHRHRSHVDSEPPPPPKDTGSASISEIPPKPPPQDPPSIRRKPPPPVPPPRRRNQSHVQAPKHDRINAWDLSSGNKEGVYNAESTKMADADPINESSSGSNAAGPPLPLKKESLKGVPIATSPTKSLEQSPTSLEVENEPPAMFQAVNLSPVPDFLNDGIFPIYPPRIINKTSVEARIDTAEPLSALEKLKDQLESAFEDKSSPQADPRSLQVLVSFPFKAYENTEVADDQGAGGQGDGNAIRGPLMRDESNTSPEETPLSESLHLTPGKASPKGIPLEAGPQSPPGTHLELKATENQDLDVYIPVNLEQGAVKRPWSTFSDIYDASVREEPIRDTSPLDPLNVRDQHERDMIYDRQDVSENPGGAPCEDQQSAENPEALRNTHPLSDSQDDGVQKSSPQSQSSDQVPEALSNAAKSSQIINGAQMEEPTRGPQVTIFPSEDENVVKSPDIASNSDVPPLPARAAPTPPMPFEDPPPKRMGSGSSKQEIGASPVSAVKRDSSNFEVASTVSSSEQSMVNTAPTLQHTTSITTISSNSTATSLGVERDQAQIDLRRLQNDLAAAKIRGDSRAAQDSLQKSIEVIRRTYLKKSTSRETLSTTKASKSPNAGFGKAILGRLPLSGSGKGEAIGEAAALGDLALVKKLLDEKVNVDARSDNYKTPLMRAAEKGHNHCLELLKLSGADEFAVDKMGRTVLHLAVISNQIKSAIWILQAYPPPAADQLRHRSSILFRATDALTGSRAQRNLREASDAEGAKPLHLAAETDDGGFVKTLLAAGVDIESRNNWGRTPLHQAIIANHRASFDTLLREGAKIDAVDAKTMTSLHWAANTGQVAIIQILLKKGARQWGQDFDRDGYKPIHHAASRGHVLAIESLLNDRKDLEKPTKAGETMLHLACINNDLEVADYLVKNMVEINAWASPQHSLLGKLSEFKVVGSSLTPLHYACCRGDYEMAVLLLDHEAWVNAPTPEGATALMMAVQAEDTNLVNLLLKRGAKVNASMPGTLMTALHFACRRGDLETVQQLCRNYANDTARLSGTNGYGQTPLDEAMKCPDKGKGLAVMAYLRTIAQNRLQSKIRARQPSQQNLHPYQGGAQNAITPTQPISYAPWGQHDVPIQGGQPAFQSPVAATYGYGFPQTQPQAPQQWFDPLVAGQFDSPPPYEPGSSVPARLAAQAPVYRPKYS